MVVRTRQQRRRAGWDRKCADGDNGSHQHHPGSRLSQGSHTKTTDSNLVQSNPYARAKHKDLLEVILQLLLCGATPQVVHKQGAGAGGRHLLILPQPVGLGPADLTATNLSALLLLLLLLVSSQCAVLVLANVSSGAAAGACLAAAAVATASVASAAIAAGVAAAAASGCRLLLLFLFGRFLALTAAAAAAAGSPALCADPDASLFELRAIQRLQRGDCAWGWSLLLGGK